MNECNWFVQGTKLAALLIVGAFGVVFAAALAWFGFLAIVAKFGIIAGIGAGVFLLIVGWAYYAAYENHRREQTEEQNKERLLQAFNKNKEQINNIKKKQNGIKSIKVEIKKLKDKKRSRTKDDNPVLDSITQPTRVDSNALTGNLLDD